MELKITQNTGNYYEFELDGTVVAYNSRNDVLVRQDGTCDFKTSEGANLLKKQRIHFSDITVVDSSGTEYVPSSIDDLFLKLNIIEFFDWFRNTGGGGVDMFRELLDTFNYVGNNGKVGVVNESLMKLEPVHLWNYKKLQEQQDVSITLSNASIDKIVAVKSVAGELKFTLTDIPGGTGFIPDQITAIQINRDGDEITIPVGAIWVINQNTYVSDTDYVTVIEPAADGFKRIDIIVANQAGTFEKIEGIESESIAQEPVRPSGTLFVTRFDIDGDDVSGGEEPNLGDAYVKKAYFNSSTFNLSGVVPELNIAMPIGQLIFTGYMTELQSINIAWDDNLFNGSRFLIQNRQATSFLLLQGGGTWPINFPLPGDYTVKPGEIIEFSVNLAGRLDFICTNMGGVGAVESVTGSTVDNTDPLNPVVNAASESYAGERADQARDEAIANTDDQIAGLELSSDQPSSLIMLKNADGDTITTLDVGFLNNEGTTFVYNSVDNTLDLVNEAGDVLSAIPVSSFVSNFAKTISFNGTTAYTLELKDSTGTVISSVNIGQSNVNGLVADLAAKSLKPVTATGTIIDFAASKIFNSPSSPATGNITDSLTGAEIGVVQKIYHNHSVAPTVPAGWKLIGSATYELSVLNIIYAEWVSGTRVEYWIVQEH